MEEPTPAERAHIYAEGARQNYERGQGLAPMIAFICDTKAVMVMAYGQTDNQPAQFGSIALVLTGRFQPHTIITVCEVWQKVFPDKGGVDATVGNIQRGDLGRAHEAGDPEVKTALMTSAWRLNPDECHNIVDTVMSESPHAYDRWEIAGVQEGHMPDMVLTGWRVGLSAQPPADITDEELFSILCRNQLASSVSLQSWEEPTTEGNGDGPNS